MNTVVLALLVAVVAALFYYPTFVRIPSAEEVSGNTAQRAATLSGGPSSAPSAQAQQTNAAAPAGQVPTAPTASAVASAVASPSQAPQASAAQVLELPPATGKKVIIVGGGLAGMSAAIGMYRTHTHAHAHARTHARTTDVWTFGRGHSCWRPRGHA